MGWAGALTGQRVACEPANACTGGHDRLHACVELSRDRLPHHSLGVALDEPVRVDGMPARLRAWLSRLAPPEAVPPTRGWSCFARLPRLPNGKIDRHALRRHAQVAWQPTIAPAAGTDAAHPAPPVAGRRAPCCRWCALQRLVGAVAACFQSAVSGVMPDGGCTSRGDLAEAAQLSTVCSAHTAADGTLGEGSWVGHGWHGAPGHPGSDHFVDDLGGDSLAAVRAVELVSRATGQRITYDDLAGFPTARKLAGLLVTMFKAARKQPPPLSTAPAQHVGVKRPRSPAPSASGATAAPRMTREAVSTGSEAAGAGSDAAIVVLSRCAGVETHSGTACAQLAQRLRRVCSQGCTAADRDRTASGTGRRQRHMRVDRLWRERLGKCVDASPLVVLCRAPAEAVAPSMLGTGGADARREPCAAGWCGVVVIGCHSRIVAGVDAFTGERLWTHVVGERVEASAAFYPQLAAAVVGCYGGVLRGFGVATGAVLFRYACGDTIKATPVSSTARQRACPT